MFRNYAAATLRNLVRNRLYAAINIIGLAFGFAAALLIAVFVRDEFSYDRFFADYQHIYLMSSELSAPGRADQYSDFMPAQLAAFLKTDLPSAMMARIAPDSIIVKAGAVENTEHIHWADPTILDIFKFKAVAGNLQNALNDPNGVVLTRKMARKYFGRDDPVGETLDVRVPIFEVSGTQIALGTQVTLKSDVLKVAAVIADLPSNTHLDINILASARNANSFIAQVDRTPPRNYFLNLETYIKLPNAAAATLVQSGLPAFVKRHMPNFARAGNGSSVNLILRPIASLHLTPSNSRIEKPRGSLSAVYGMAGIGLLIVFAAAVNFVNLMTARALRRATEVGVRKATGAQRRNLVVQFIGEATLYVAVGMGCGLALTAILLPRLNVFLDRTIALGMLNDIGAVCFIVAFVVLAGILAGAYPAFVLASIRPATVLRGAVGRHASSRLRQVLVVLQFALLIGLLIATAVVYRQTAFAFTEAQRLDTDQVVLILGAEPCKPAFKQGLSAIPGVRDAACSSSGGIGLGAGGAGAAKAVNGNYVALEQGSVGYGAFEFYGLKPLAGRFFSEGHPSDVMPADANAPIQGAVVLNESAVRALGFASPQEAVGKSTSLNQRTGALSEIIGVVPDFAGDAVHRIVPPTVYVVNHDYQGVLSVRIDGSRAPEALAAIDELWKAVGPPYPIVRQFLDAHIALLYRDLTREEALFAAFAGVAISIALLGLFGMSAALCEQRIKEIGVRKAMGANSREIVRLLLWQFTQPVLWANLIAWPAAGYFMQRWLEGFAHHIDLAAWMFVAASALALVVALLTVSGHALLVAQTQPVTALRYE